MNYSYDLKCYKTRVLAISMEKSSWYLIKKRWKARFKLGKVLLSYKFTELYGQNSRKK